MATDTTIYAWHGIDFNPFADPSRTLRLCPDGWLELEWAGEEMQVGRTYGITMDAALELDLAAAGLGPIDYGLTEWPAHRRFIGLPSYDSDGKCWVLDLLMVDGVPVFGDAPADEAKAPEDGPLTTLQASIYKRDSDGNYVLTSEQIRGFGVRLGLFEDRAVAEAIERVNQTATAEDLEDAS